jgi:hypothetical protein
MNLPEVAQLTGKAPEEPSTIGGDRHGLTRWQAFQFRFHIEEAARPVIRDDLITGA